MNTKSLRVSRIVVYTLSTYNNSLGGFWDAHSLATVVLLSKGSTADMGTRLSINTADHPTNRQRVVLVHLTESCPFPAYSDMPRDIDGSVSTGFNSKAIPLVLMYQEKAFIAVGARLAWAENRVSLLMHLPTCVYWCLAGKGVLVYCE